MKYLITLCLLLSYLNCYLQNNPLSIGDVILWLCSDSVSLNNDRVEIWHDKSGYSHDATQNTFSSMPTFTTNVNLLNGYPTLIFDGINDFLNLPNSAMPVQNHTIYALVKVNSDFSNKTIYARAYTTSGYYIRINASSNFTINNFSLLGTNAVNDNNYKLLRFDFDGITMRSYINTMLNNSVNHPNPGPINYNSNDAASIGALKGSSGGVAWFLNGEIVEFLVFSKVLNLTETVMINNYFKNKYAPPVSLGNDTTLYSFCPYSLSAGNRFISYLWSNGATTESISVSQSGTYWVHVTDIFGNISSDTVIINFPEISTPVSNLYCPGDSVIWNTGLGNNYLYLWSNGQTTENIIINSPNLYYVTITDSLNCSRTFPSIYFEEDNYSSIFSLGSDTNLCSGNILHLSNGADQTVSFLWNIGSTDSIIVVDTSGMYSVIGQNFNGCIASDSIYVTIIGVAPYASFVSQNFCTGSPTSFTDVSYSSNTILHWSWNFGDSSPSATNQNPTYTYLSSGTYPVTLTVTTDVGCSDDTTIFITIYPIPEANFIVLDSCERGNTFFADQSISNYGSLNNWHWNFGVSNISTDTSNVSNPQYSYLEEGLYSVNLIVTNSVGCKDTIIKNVLIKPAATANFTVNKECLGEPIQFTNLTTTQFPLNITNFKWYFGTTSNDSSNVINPIFIFNSIGNYPVTLVVSTDNGCKHSYTDTLHIDKFVDAAFVLPDDTLCKGSTYLFTDNSNYFNTQPAQWLWSLGGTIAGNQNPQYITPLQSGMRTLRLTVTSTDNCVDSMKANVFFKNPPVANFTATPQVSAPPLISVFNYTGTPGVQLAWDFGDGAFASGNPVTHTYLNTGLYTATLIATDPNGCSDTAMRHMNVVVPVFDVQLQNLICTENNGYVQFQANIQNLSTVTITNMELEAWIQGAQPAMQHWQGELFIGNTLNYQSPYSLQVPVEGSSYCCFRIKEITGIISDTTLNETLCVPLKNTFSVFTPYPNPTTGRFFMHLIIPVADEAIVAITDLQGKQLYEQVFTLPSGLHTLQFDASFLSAGVYSVAVYYRGERQVVRVLKQF